MTTLVNRIVRFTTAAALGLGLLWSAPSRGAPPNTIANSVAVCDPWSPQSCSQPNSSGETPVANNPYPNAATPVTGASGNVANASAVAALPAVASKTNYISGLQLTAGGATAAACVTATVTGLISGTASYTFCAPAGATVGANPLDLTFYPPVPASAANTAITVTLPALGAGNTNATAAVQGYVK